MGSGSTGSVEAFIRSDEEKDLLRFITAGSVDDGKSTLIGRLLYESQGVHEDQLASVKKQGAIDFALITDGLRAEREQGITIDVAYRYFATPKRKFIIADTPGHEQYTRNMATGASTANLAVILVDARLGVLPQSRRHAFIASLLGLQHIVVAVNKMDLVEFREDVFESICAAFRGFASQLQVPDLFFIPISALYGDNVVHKSDHMPWYDGPTLLHHVETVHIASDLNLTEMRLPVQLVLRPNPDFRGYAGQLASGVLRTGDPVMVLPSGRTSRVKSILTRDGELTYAFAPMSVTVCLEDQVDVSRGDMLAPPSHPPRVARNLDIRLIWMNETPLELEKQYIVKHTSQTVKAEIRSVRYRFDIHTLQKQPATTLRMNEIGAVELATYAPLFVDAYKRNRATGSVILIDPVTDATVAAGMITGRLQAENVKAEAQGTTIWLTGLSGAGKSTIANLLAVRLRDSGTKVEVLDGDLLRATLCKGLGFSREDREENIRRIGFLCELLTRHGITVIVAAISPYRATRDEVRAKVTHFLEVYVSCPLDVLVERDPKGLYKRALAGEISHFTGISDPYEPPEHPDVTIDSSKESPDTSVERVWEKLPQMML